MNSLILTLLSARLRALGYCDYVALSMSKDILEDLLINRKVPLRNRIWALQHGFFSNKFEHYGLSRNNYKDFLSDFDYAWLNPQNDRFNQWIDDKLTFRYMLQPFADYLPEYYFHISKKGILRLLDCPTGFKENTDGFFRLLQEKRTLAAKMFVGSRGMGFYKLSYENNGYTLNNRQSTVFEIEKLIEYWRLSDLGYLVIDYHKPHNEFANIWSDAPNTLRITMLRRPNRALEVGFALTRFGTKTSGIVDNTYAGGIACVINPDTGFYSKGYQNDGDGLIELKTHPDTGALLEGVVPFWHEIIHKLKEILNYLPQLSFAGFDVAVTQNGFKILEINAQPSIEFIQVFVPINKDATMGEYFKDKLDQKNKFMKKENRMSFSRKIAAKFGAGSKEKNIHTNILLIQSSPVFNEEWYRKEYPDLDLDKTDPARHYLLVGGFEDRNPGPDFNSKYYLDLYDDVRRAGVNPLVHYLKHGESEGRRCVPIEVHRNL